MQLPKSAGLSAGLAMALGITGLLGVPSALAAGLVGPHDVFGCNGSLNACGRQTDPPVVSGGKAHANGDTYTRNHSRAKISVIENYETNHWWGWATDASWNSGQQDKSGVVEQGTISCSGGTYEFYERSYLDGYQFDSNNGEVFTCPGL